MCEYVCVLVCTWGEEESWKVTAACNFSAPDVCEWPPQGLPVISPGPQKGWEEVVWVVHT